MDKPNNRKADDREPLTKDSDSESVSESIGGSYYYDDATGYEIYQGDDDESWQDESDGTEND